MNKDAFVLELRLLLEEMVEYLPSREAWDFDVKVSSSGYAIVEVAVSIHSADHGSYLLPVKMLGEPWPDVKLWLLTELIQTLQIANECEDYEAFTQDVWDALTYRLAGAGAAVAAGQFDYAQRFKLAPYQPAVRAAPILSTGWCALVGEA